MFILEVKMRYSILLILCLDIQGIGITLFYSMHGKFTFAIISFYKELESDVTLLQQTTDF